MSDEPVADPGRIQGRADFGRELTLLRQRAGLSVRELALRAGVPAATVGGYLSARHLPSSSQAHVLTALLDACGVIGANEQATWLDALARARARSDARKSRLATPYRGLEPFGPEDAELYFGREGMLERVLAAARRVRAERAAMLAVVGPSGSGKSSLLRAGLLPAARSGALDPHQRSWTCAIVTPSEPDPPPPARLIVVDQAEEMFTLLTDEARRDYLIGLRASAAGSIVVFGLRADFYADALGEPMLGPVLQDHQVVLTPMTAEQVRRAIVDPARQVGADVEDALVDIILRDLAPSGGRGSYAHDPGALPMLSHALLSTWSRAQRNQLTVADYHSAGGLQGAIQQTAEEVFAQLTPEEQEVARRVFLRLVNVTDDAVPTRRRVGGGELAALTGADDELGAVRARVLDRFVAARLLTADRDSIEVSHEALLTAWPRLRGWLEEDRAGLRLHRQLTQAANAWQSADRDDSLLLRARRLALIGDWVASARSAVVLNRIEQDFLDRSNAFADAERRAARRRTRRLQQSLAAATVFAVLCGVLAVVAVSERATANAQRSAAAQARDDALSRQVALQVQKLRTSQPALAGELALAAYRIAPTTEARAALLDTSAFPTATRLLGPPGPMQSIAVDASGKLLAATGADGRVHLWSVAAGTQSAIGALGAPDPQRTLFAVAISPSLPVLATGGSDHAVQLWDIRNPKQPRRLGAPLTGPKDTVYSLAFSPGGDLLAAGSADGTVHLWRLAGGTSGGTATALPTLAGPGGYVQSVAFDSSGATLAAATAGQRAAVWRLSAGHAGKPLVVSTSSPLLSIALSPDARTLVAGAKDGRVHRWRLAGTAAARLPDLTRFTSWVNTLAFSPDGQYLASGSSDKSVRVWSADSGAVFRTFTEASAVTAAAFVSGRDALAVASNDGEVRLWPMIEPTLPAGGGTIFSTGYDSTGSVMFAGRPGVLSLWRSPEAANPVRSSITPTAGSADPDGAAAVSPDGRLAVSATSSGPAQLWDVQNPAQPRLLATLTGPTGTDESATFSPDGRLLAISGDDSSVHLWDVAVPASPRPLPTLTGFGSYVFASAFSPDGRSLAAASADKTVQIWNLADPRSPKRSAIVRGFANYVYAVAFTPDGRTLAAAGADDTVRLFDVRDSAHPRALGRPLTGPTGYLMAMAISPNGRLLAAVGQDSAVWLWDIADRTRPTLLASLFAAPGPNYAVAFSPDGRFLVTGGADGLVHRWLVDTDEVAAQICATAGDAVTRAEWRQYVPGAAYQPPCG